MLDLDDHLRSELRDRYEIEREIGHGGMAVVYLARDVRHERPVALKVLHGDFAEPHAGERFLREIKLVARLHHPHLLPLFDSGRAGDLPFYVCPYIEGGSLRDRLNRTGRLATAEALRLAREVAEGLDHAHRHGVIHRDVKPENVLLEDGHAIVADFGIARALTAAEFHLTRTGMPLGTPAYMSPEQARGGSVVDARSDVYAVGCVLYEMLAGVPPFAAETAIATLARRLVEPPPTLAAAGVGAAPEVEALLAATLATRPDDRFRSAGELAEALGAVRDRGAVVATPTGPVPAVVGAPRRIVSLAVLPFVDMSVEPGTDFLTDGLTEELINALTRVDGLRVTARTSAFAFKGRDVDAREIGRTLNVGAILEGSVRRAGSRLRIAVQLVDTVDGYHLWSETFDRELTDVFALQDDLARSIVDALRSRIGGGEAGTLVRPPTTNVEAYTSYLRGLHCFNRRTIEGFHRAVAHYETALRLDPHYVLAYVGLADCHTFLGFDWYGGMPPANARPRATAAVLRALELDPTNAEAAASLGVIRMLFDWQPDEAEANLRRALELRPNYGFAHHWLGMLRMTQGRYDEALTELRRAIEVDPISMIANQSIGRVHYFARRYDDALAELERTLEMDPKFETTHLLLGCVLSRVGRLEEARAALERALELGGPQPVVLGHLARVQGWLGRRAAARALLDQLVDLRRRRYVPAMSFCAASLGLGDLDEATRALERSVAEGSTTLPFARVEPLYDEIRSHPRFVSLLERVALGREPTGGRNP